MRKTKSKQSPKSNVTRMQTKQCIVDMPNMALCKYPLYLEQRSLPNAIYNQYENQYCPGIELALNKTQK